MTLKPETVVELVKSKKDAEKVIAALLTRFGGAVASDRLNFDARDAHQTVEEKARRIASNLLTSSTKNRFDPKS